MCVCVCVCVCICLFARVCVLGCLFVHLNVSVFECLCIYFGSVWCFVRSRVHALVVAMACSCVVRVCLRVVLCRSVLHMLHVHVFTHMCVCVRAWARHILQEFAEIIVAHMRTLLPVSWPACV